MRHSAAVGKADSSGYNNLIKNRDEIGLAGL